MIYSLGLVISSQARITPEAYQPFLDAWHHVGRSLSEFEKRLPIKDRLVVHSKEIEGIVNRILGRSSVISLYAAWMQADEGLPFKEGLLKTKAFVEEQFEIMTPCPGFYAAISKLPEEDFCICILWIRRRIRQINEKSENWGEQKKFYQSSRGGISHGQADWFRLLRQGLDFVMGAHSKRLNLEN